MPTPSQLSHLPKRTAGWMRIWTQEDAQAAWNTIEPIEAKHRAMGFHGACEAIEKVGILEATLNHVGDFRDHQIFPDISLADQPAYVRKMLAMAKANHLINKNVASGWVESGE